MKAAKIYSVIVLLFFVATKTSAQKLPYIQATHLTWSVIYDYNHMAPSMVYYILQESDFQGVQLSKPKHFKQDYRLPPPRVKNNAFTFDGYQRGHLCPSGDRDSRRDWFRDTYYTSNLLPMTAEVNAGAWKDTELYCRKIALSGHVLKIACGPIWNDTVPQWNATHTMRVPGSFWKLCVCTLHPHESVLWLVPNDHTSRKQFQCRHDPLALPPLLPNIIINYLQSWLQTRFPEE